MDKEKFIKWLENRRMEVSENYVNKKEKDGAIHMIDFITAQIGNGVFNLKDGGK